MILDIGFIILLIVFIFLGYKRGFTLEFFNMFKYIFIIFITKYIYKFFLSSEKIKSRNQFEIFIVVVAIQYIIYSIFLISNKRFLQSIKIKKFDKFFGMIFGIIKIFFVGIIVYIIIMSGSLYSKRIRDIREKSMSVQFITKYILNCTDSFPNFIKRNIETYAVRKKENEIINNVLNDYKKLQTQELEKNISKKELQEKMKKGK